MAPRLYRHARSNLTAAGGTELLRAHSASWHEQNSDVGFGSFAINNDDAQLSLISKGDFIRVTDDTNPAMRAFFVVENRRKATVDEGEEWGQTTVFEGRGHGCVLEEGIVLPEWFGFEGKPTTDYRTFGFASRYFDDSTWPAAVVSSDDMFGTPQDWHDTRDGSWIWDRTVNGAFTAPVMDAYFRKVYSTAAAKRAVIFMAVDDLGELWHNNALLTVEEDWYKGQSRSAEVELTPGDNLIAVKASNVNVAKAGLKVACYLLDANNEPGTLLFESDATWKCLGVEPGDDVPGYTPGGILEQALFEMSSQDIVAGHHALADVTIGFDQWNDSDGTAWPTVTDFAVRIGTSILDLARMLAEVYVDWAMDRDTLRLEAWVKGQRGGASGVQLYAGQGGSITSLVHEGTG